MRFSPSVKFFLNILMYAMIAWLGAVVMRTVIANEFFAPGTLQYDPRITVSQEQVLFQLITASTYIVLGAYYVVLISAIVLAFILPYKWKENGWLFIAAILFFAFVPAEIFTSYLDVKFIIMWENTKPLINHTDANLYLERSAVLHETLSHRISALRGIPVIATLCYLTAIAFVMWQPLKKKVVSAV
jgi:hypothetical protein